MPNTESIEWISIIMSLGVQNHTQFYPPLAIFFIELPCLKVYTRACKDGIIPLDPQTCYFSHFRG